MKVQVFFTSWGKCRDTGIIQNYNVTDSSNVLSSSFFTNQRTVRCYTLCSQSQTKQNKQNYVSFLQGLLHLTLFDVMHRAPSDQVSYFQGFPVTCQATGSARDIWAPLAG